MKITELANALRKLFLSRHMAASTLSRYQTQWKLLQQFCIDTYGNEEFDIERGMAYLQKVSGDQHADLTGPLTPYQVHILRVINTMADYQLHGVITRLKNTRSCHIVLSGELTSVLSDYGKELADNGCAKRTVQSRLWVAERFLDYLQQTGKTDLRALSLPDCQSFMNTWAHHSASSIATFLASLRNLMGYLYATSRTESDLAEKLHLSHVPRHSLIPSCWEQEEIKKLLDSIDRNNPIGKRDYAMILLACVMGIRCGDISQLRMGDFDWATHRLRFVQHKTGVPIELPIPQAVGWAVIDYIKNGRPRFFETDIVFLKHVTPFNAFSSSSALTRMLDRLRRKAGIPKANQRRGFHSLRHTAACGYLEMGTTLPVIAEILGHSEIQSTTGYLKRDLEKLAECVLDPVETKDENE